MKALLYSPPLSSLLFFISSPSAFLRLSTIVFRLSPLFLFLSLFLLFLRYRPPLFGFSFSFFFSAYIASLIPHALLLRAFRLSPSRVGYLVLHSPSPVFDFRFSSPLFLFLLVHHLAFSSDWNTAMPYARARKNQAVSLDLFLETPRCRESPSLRRSVARVHRFVKASTLFWCLFARVLRFRSSSLLLLLLASPSFVLLYVFVVFFLLFSRFAFPGLSLFAKRVSFRRLSVSTPSSHSPSFSSLFFIFWPGCFWPPLSLFPPLYPSSSLFVRGNLLRLSYRKIPMIIRWKFHADEHPPEILLCFLQLVASCHALIILFDLFRPFRSGTERRSPRFRSFVRLFDFIKLPLSFLLLHACYIMKININTWHVCFASVATQNNSVLCSKHMRIDKKV